VSKSLYICYFGLREPLVQTQVLPYIREIRKAGIEFVLLTFEPTGQDETKFEEYRAELASEGIDWHWLRYHKRFSVLATAYDIFRGTLFVWQRIGKGDIDLVHSRVHVPQMMASLARRFSRNKPKLLFDIRGFFPEEYTDAGIWPEGGFIYGTVKRVERWLMRDADGFVVLTEKAREILFPGSLETGCDNLGRPVEVIPCCVDLNKFVRESPDSIDEGRKKINATGKFVIAYVGSFGGWYLTSELLELFRTARALRQDAFALILTQRDSETIESLIKNAGYGTGEFVVKSVKPNEISHYLNSANVAVSLIKACYSKLSSSPTKIAEYLACGIPVIANAGIGDVDSLITQKRVGVLVTGFNPADYANAFARLEELGEIGENCRKIAISEFGLEECGGPRYRSLYSRILGSS